jgi:hypothetical protein
MTEGLFADPDASADGWDRFDPANTSPVVAYLCSEASGWLTGSILRVHGDTVQRLQPWDIDWDCTYLGRPGQAVDATDLDRGLRTAFRLLPSGLPSGGIAS